MRGLLGKKIGMTRIFDEFGNVVPVTVLEAGPCVVTQMKTSSVDGYDAIQVGYLDKKPKHLSKALKGHFEKSGVSPKKFLAEFEQVPGFDYKLGQSFHVGIFSEGDFVRVSGISKGKGFTGVIKRHNFSRQKKTHGTGHTERAPGFYWAGLRPISCISWYENGRSAWEIQKLQLKILKLLKLKEKITKSSLKVLFLVQRMELW